MATLIEVSIRTFTVVNSRGYSKLTQLCQPRKRVGRRSISQQTSPCLQASLVRASAKRSSRTQDDPPEFIANLQILKADGKEVYDVGVRHLTMNDHGNDVRALQKFLVAQGYFPKQQLPTGYYGQVTRDAVATWQRTNGIEETGSFGAASRWLLLKQMDAGIKARPAAPSKLGILEESASKLLATTIAMPTVPSSLSRASVATGAQLLFATSMLLALLGLTAAGVKYVTEDDNPDKSRDDEPPRPPEPASLPPPHQQRDPPRESQLMGAVHGDVPRENDDEQIEMLLLLSNFDKKED
mmetsp:Transcript_18444/g.35083  ORF Transcript_18444/g.35083 Transcript_18444/m.35083 type:complete len:297 (-) Transcript_18444:194-1084(-)